MEWSIYGMILTKDRYEVHLWDLFGLSSSTGVQCYTPDEDESLTLQINHFKKIKFLVT